MPHCSPVNFDSSSAEIVEISIVYRLVGTMSASVFEYSSSDKFVNVCLDYIGSICKLFANDAVVFGLKSFPKKYC